MGQWNWCEGAARHDCARRPVAGALSIAGVELLTAERLLFALFVLQGGSWCGDDRRWRPSCRGSSRLEGFGC